MGVYERGGLLRERLPPDRVHQLVDDLTRKRVDDRRSEDRAVLLCNDLDDAAGLTMNDRPTHRAHGVVRYLNVVALLECLGLREAHGSSLRMGIHDHRNRPVIDGGGLTGCDVGDRCDRFGETDMGELSVSYTHLTLPTI